jgi:hypothetical protein
MKIPSHSLLAILTDVDPLIGLHQEFNASLLKSRDDSIGLAALFLNAKNFLDVYKEYVANYPKTLAVIEQLVKENKEFGKFHTNSTADPRMASRHLSSFYIAPVQRLPRYVLLLKELRHAYEKTIKQAGELFNNPSMASSTVLDEDIIAIQMNPDVLHVMESELASIDQAIEAMNKSAILVNEYQKEVEGYVRLEQIHTKLGKKHQALQLKEPQKTGRRLIREDTIRQDKNGKLRDITAVLCNDAIFLLNHPTNTEFKGGINLLHLSFRTSSASTFYNDRWNIQFKEIPAAPGGEYYIDFRCHEQCFDHHGGITPKAKDGKDKFDNTLYYSTISRDMLLGGPAQRPQSASVSAMQEEQAKLQLQKEQELARIDTNIISQLCIDKSHSVVFFRLVFPTNDAVNSYAKQLSELIDTVRAQSTVGYQTHRQRRHSNAIAPPTSLDVSRASSAGSSQNSLIAPPTNSTGGGGYGTGSSTSLRPPSAFIPPTPGAMTPAPSTQFQPFSPQQHQTNPFSSPDFNQPALPALPTNSTHPNSAGNNTVIVDTGTGAVSPPQNATRRASITANPLAFTPSAAPAFVFKPNPKPEPKKEHIVVTAPVETTVADASRSVSQRPGSAAVLAPPPGFSMPQKPQPVVPGSGGGPAPPAMGLPALPDQPKAPATLPGLAPPGAATGKNGLIAPAPRRATVIGTTTPAVNPFAKPTIG